MSATITSRYVDVEGMGIHYLEAGTGEPVVLIHGWPTSSFLWRNVMVPIAESNRVVAIDLPGFGQSDKPLDAVYSFRFYSRVMDGFLDALDIDTIGLAVHDLGGPVGLYWACRHPERLSRLAILNTLVYPRMSWAVVLFLLACRLPGLRTFMTSPRGLRAALRIGINDPSKITEETVQGVLAPFQSDEARLALLKAGTGLHVGGFKQIANLLPSLDVPVRVVYGERDRILPDVARTMAHVARDLPQTEVTVLADCGHFLQEERPEEVGRLLADFFAPA